MPCIGQTSDNQVTDLNNTIRLREAMLCGLMTALEANEALETYVNSIDYREGGFTRRQLMSWWSRHKEADRARRKRESRESKIQTARAKLTAAERKLLGF